MKKTVATLAILTLASAMPLAAEAKITPNGTSGIINTPSAFVRLPGHVSVGYDMTRMDRSFMAMWPCPWALKWQAPALIRKTAISTAQ